MKTSEDQMEIDGTQAEGLVDVLDEYQMAFDALEEIEATNTADTTTLIAKYIELMKNERFDENAVRVKENIIYK